MNDDKIMQEALSIHNQAIDQASELESQLARMSNDSTISKDSIKVWGSILKDWKSHLIEVPQMEGHAAHSHEHDHNQVLPDMTPEQILNLQKELKSQLDSLKLRINAKSQR